MIRFRLPLTLALAALLMVDLIVGFRLWSSGWPKEIALSSPQAGVELVKVIDIPFTKTDWLILSAVITMHIALGLFAWKAWRSPVQA